MSLSWQSLVFFLRDSLSGYSENFLVLKNQNPAIVNLNGQTFSVHISNIHDSGNTRKNPDEERIQINKGIIQEQRERSKAGATPLFLGFFQSGEVFTAWEPAYVFSQNPKVGGGSVYARFSHEKIALEKGGALRLVKGRNLDRQSVTLSMRADALGLYFENWATLHTTKNDVELQALASKLINATTPEEKTGHTEINVTIGGKRKRITVTRECYARDPKFRDAVLQAYNRSCCVCGRQLGLVQAAHIIPHNHPDCRDEISNGLALCVEHHKLYDDGLLLPRSGRKLHINPERVEHLKNIGQAIGIESLKSFEKEGFRLPQNAKNHPNEDFLERGLRIRLGTDT
jgi:putative restriction endonuclease